jgi:hypothetical protein
MKDQYFADINDYRKYGLLRALSGNGKIKIAVCWMLTPDDAGTDGRSTRYLTDPTRWKEYDPSLFDSLASCMSKPSNRNIQWAEDHHLISAATYFPDLLADRMEERRRYFKRFAVLSASADLVFFDPDNGIEVKSKTIGSKNSNKYVYWSELIDTFSAGKSLLVYQHFIREKRDTFTQRKVDEFRNRLGISAIHTFRTSHVLFILAPQPRHRPYLAEKSAEILKIWQSQIAVSTH